MIRIYMIFLLLGGVLLMGIGCGTTYKSRPDAATRKIDDKEREKDDVGDRDLGDGADKEKLEPLK